jgi:beta-glucosidase
VEGGGFEILVGSSAAAIHGALRVEVTSEFTATPVPGPAAFVASDAEFESMLGHAIPQPAPALPFHRNSTVDDLAATVLGRLVQKTLLKLAGRQFSAMGAQDAPNAETLVRMFEAVIRESPLRSLVALTGGRVSHAALDGLLDALNGHWGKLLGRAVGRR